MTVAYPLVRHHVGHDQEIVRLREKFYAKGDGFDVACRTDEKRTLTRFCVIDEQENGIPFKCLSHPSSYFSPSLASTDGWDLGQWRSLLSGLRSRGGWDIARFNMLTPGQAVSLRAAALKAGYLSTISEASWPIVKGGRTFAEYVASRRSSFNRNQNRCKRLMDAQGFSFTSDLDFEQVLDVYRARTHIKGEDDYSVKPEFQGFLSGLRDTLKAAGRWHEVGVVKEGKLHAFVIGFWDNEGVFYCYQTSYNPEFKSLRLGALCFEKIIEDALSKGASHISFMGDSSYFNQFTSDFYRFHMVDIFAHTPKSWLILGKRKAARAVVQGRSLWQKVVKPAPAGASDGADGIRVPAGANGAEQAS